MQRYIRKSERVSRCVNDIADPFFFLLPGLLPTHKQKPDLKYINGCHWIAFFQFKACYSMAEQAYEGKYNEAIHSH